MTVEEKEEEDELVKKRGRRSRKVRSGESILKHLTHEIKSTKEKM